MERTMYRGFVIQVAFYRVRRLINGMFSPWLARFTFVPYFMLTASFKRKKNAKRNSNVPSIMHYKEDCKETCSLNYPKIKAQHIAVLSELMGAYRLTLYYSETSGIRPIINTSYLALLYRALQHSISVVRPRVPEPD